MVIIDCGNQKIEKRSAQSPFIQVATFRSKTFVRQTHTYTHTGNSSISTQIKRFLIVDNRDRAFEEISQLSAAVLAPPSQYTVL